MKVLLNCCRAFKILICYHMYKNVPFCSKCCCINCFTGVFLLEYWSYRKEQADLSNVTTQHFCGIILVSIFVYFLYSYSHYLGLNDSSFSVLSIYFIIFFILYCSHSFKTNRYCTTSLLKTFSYTQLKKYFFFNIWQDYSIYSF